MLFRSKQQKGSQHVTGNGLAHYERRRIEHAGGPESGIDGSDLRPGPYGRQDDGVDQDGGQCGQIPAGHFHREPCGTLATAIAAQVGTGNIVGASGAILSGGPGAIFWMWIIAFFGMATIYAEATLAIRTRQADSDGSYRGGPVYYITTAFQGGFGKFLAGFFAVAIILAR